MYSTTLNVFLTIHTGENKQHFNLFEYFLVIHAVAVNSAGYSAG